MISTHEAQRYFLESNKYKEEARKLADEVTRLTLENAALRAALVWATNPTDPV